MRTRALGNLEFAILRVLIDRPRDAYGATIQERLEVATSHDYSIGAIYTALDRLEKKDMVKSWWGEPTSERGGRRKRYYEIRSSGRQAVSETEATYSRSRRPGLVPGVA